MIAAFYSPDSDTGRWLSALRRVVPEVEWRVAPDLGDVRYIKAALVWRPPPGWLASLPNLMLILSQGAGVDHILADPQLPRRVPILRLIDPYMTRSMVEYVTFQVLRLHLKEPDFRRQQEARIWRQLVPPSAHDRHVGILGLGELGSACALALTGLGFRVSGWSRTPKRLEGVTCYSGPDEYDAFLAQSEILACLVPLTSETRGILGRATFERLPRGAGLINAGRGGHLVEADLLSALDSGQIGDAVLDVFETEPLPPEHPFWSHPHIVVSPHVAALTNPETAAEVIGANLRRLLAGDNFPDRIDLKSGY
jgi:glyoxylate/hydroxypyruvate reductase